MAQATFTVAENGTYRSADGLENIRLYAGDVIPVETAVRLQVPGARLPLSSYSGRFGGDGLTLKLPDSDAAEGEGPDYTAAIQAALDAGKIVEGAGRYAISAPLRFPTGSGLVSPHYRGMQIELADGANCDMAVLDDPSDVDILIQNVTFWGNGENQTATSRGIVFAGDTDTVAHQANAQYVDQLPAFAASADAHRRLIDVMVIGTRDDGIVLAGRDSNHCVRTKTFNCRGVGWNIDCWGAWFDQCDSGVSGKQGWLLSGNVGASAFIACKSWFSGVITEADGYGFDISGGGNRFIGCEAQDNANHGYRLTSTAAWNVLSGVVSEANGSLYDEFGVLVQNVQGLEEPPARTLTDVCGYHVSGANNQIIGSARDRFATKRMDWAVRAPLPSANNIIELVTGELAGSSVGTLYNSSNVYENVLNNEIHINRQTLGRSRYGSYQANLADFFVGSDSGDALRIGAALNAIFVRGPSLGTNAQKNAIEIQVGGVLNTGQFTVITHNGTTATTRLLIDGATGNVRLPSLPTSSAGLAAGTLWNDAGTLKIA
jgi:hypothetical protein